MLRARLRRLMRDSRPRRGAALVEGAVVLSVLFLVLFAMLDLALAVLHYNSLSEASRRVARAAIVHGENAPPGFGSWGPATYQATADDETDIAAVSRPVLVALDPAHVNIEVQWPDGDHRLDDRVRVSLAYDYRPLFCLGILDNPITLSATSTMRISH